MQLWDKKKKTLAKGSARSMQYDFIQNVKEKKNETKNLKNFQENEKNVKQRI